MRILGTPLGWIMHACYSVVQNYGLALIMFTLLTRLVLLPMSIKQQKGMVKMAMFRPKMEEIQKKYAKNPQKMNEEMANLYAREGYNPLSGCLPTLIQFPILFGLIDVIYNPLTHMLKMDKQVIARAIEIAKTVLGEGGMSRYSMEMNVLTATTKDISAFAELGSEFISQIQNFDFTFFGMDMSVVPSLALNVYLLIPIISGLSSFAMSWMSKKNSAAPEQQGSSAAMNSMLLMAPIMSIWIAFEVPAGVGIYWLLSNLLMLVQQYVLNKVYNPKEQAAKAQAELEAQRAAEREEKQEARRQAKERRAEKDRQRAAIEAENKKRRPNQRIELPEDDDEDEDESGLTQKEINRKKLAAARKRDAEKYGEEYVEVEDGDLD